MGGEEPPAYYQRSLCAILRGATDTHANVLLPEEVDCALRVLALPSAAQRLLFRLHLRKHSWLRVGTDIEYADVPNVTAAMRVLARSGFVHILPRPAAASQALPCDCAAESDECAAWLPALRVPELRKLCTAMRIRAPSNACRSAIIGALLAPCDSRQMRLPFGSVPRTTRRRSAEEACKVHNSCATVTCHSPIDIASSSSDETDCSSVSSLIALTVDESGVAQAHKAHIAAQASQIARESLIRQCTNVRTLISRLAALHLLTFDVLAADEDKPGAGVSVALSLAVLADIQRVAYAPYSIARTRPAFASRDELIAYEATAARLARLQQTPDVEGSIAAANMLRGNDRVSVVNASSLCWLPGTDSAVADVLLWLQSVEACAHDTRPYFLRRFTAGWLLTRIIDEHVSVLETAQRWAEACVLLRALLGQLVFCRRQRGRWWERLVIDAASHKGETSPSADARTVAVAILNDALADEHVRHGARHSFVRRLSRISAKAVPLAVPPVEHATTTDPWGDFAPPPPRAPLPIAAPINENALGYRSAAAIRRAPEKQKTGRRGATAICADDDDDLQCEPGVEIETVRAEPVRMHLQGPQRLLYAHPELGGNACSVEQLALAHYEAEGQWEGVHCEGSLWSTLFGIIMWEALFFANVPDVFQGPCQDAPLDLRTDGFYAARQKLIDDRLAQMASATATDICATVSECHAAFVGVRAAGVLWDTFPLPKLVAVCRATPPQALSSILRIIATEYHGGPPSGMPDLFLYRELRGMQPECVFVEVKSTFDRLSDKQRFWQTVLVGLGLRCVVCRVTER